MDGSEVMVGVVDASGCVGNGEIEGAQRKLQGLAKAASTDEMARTLRGMRCTEHHKSPTNIRVVGDRLNADFCCEKFRGEAMAKYKAGIDRAIRG